MQSVQVRVMSRSWLYGLTAAFCILILGGALILNARQPPSSSLPDRRVLIGTDVVDFCTVVQAKLHDERFDDLEQMGRDLTSLKDRFVGGEEKLGPFYGYLALDGCTTSICEGRPVQPDNIRKIQDWLDRKPGSTIAKTAMATNWYWYAWVARTCADFADVTFEGWQQFFERIRIARSYLAFDLHESPAAYVIMSDILRQTGGTRAKIDALYDEGQSAFPAMIMLTSAYARAIDPGWFGRKGDLEWLAESRLRDPGGDIGLIAYGVIAEQTLETGGSRDFFNRTGLSWDKIKESFAARKRLYGLSVHDWNVYGYMAFMASDREAAREAYAGFTPNWDSSVWQDQRVYFQRMLPWVNNQ
jgi:hypothetical protein